MERGRKTFFWDKPLKYNYDPNFIVSAFILNQPFSSWPALIFVEKFETANWSLGQGDEEVDKRIIEKKYIFKQIAQYFGLKTNLLQGLKEKKRKKEQKIRYK